MKQRIMYGLFLLLFLGNCGKAGAQDAPNGKHKATPEEHMEKRASFIAQNLMLDDAKSVQFTEMYKRYLQEMRTCMAGLREKKTGDKTQLSDAEIEQQIRQRFERGRKILDLREKYYDEFKKVLSQQQILKMYSIERKFGRHAQRELANRKNGKSTRSRNNR